MVGLYYQKKLSLKNECVEFLNDYFEWVQPLVHDAPIETLILEQCKTNYRQENGFLKFTRLKNLSTKN